MKSSGQRHTDEAVKHAHETSRSVGIEPRGARAIVDRPSVVQLIIGRTLFGRSGLVVSGQPREAVSCRNICRARGRVVDASAEGVVGGGECAVGEGSGSWQSGRKGTRAGEGQ